MTEYELLLVRPKDGHVSLPERGVGRMNLRGGVTVIDQRTSRATIIIDATLPPDLQSIYQAHEAAQLAVIQQERTRGVPFSSCCAVAHEAGLQAGIAEAIRLGTLDTYLAHRGVATTRELR